MSRRPDISAEKEKTKCLLRGGKKGGNCSFFLFRGGRRESEGGTVPGKAPVLCYERKKKRKEAAGCPEGEKENMASSEREERRLLAKQGEKQHECWSLGKGGTGSREKEEKKKGSRDHSGSREKKSTSVLLREKEGGPGLVYFREKNPVNAEKRASRMSRAKEKRILQKEGMERRLAGLPSKNQQTDVSPGPGKEKRRNALGAIEVKRKEKKKVFD